jgi:hypothetical protein
MPNNSRDAPQLGILLLQITTHTAMLRYRIRNGISLWRGNVDAATLNNDDNNIRPFIRLQKAIKEQSDDQSFFAWKQDHRVTVDANGLLATSPVMFAHSSSLIRGVSSRGRSAYRMTNRGLEIQLRVTCTLRGGDLMALLHCDCNFNRNATIGIYVRPMTDGRFIRTEPDKWEVVPLPIDQKYRAPHPKLSTSHSCIFRKSPRCRFSGFKFMKSSQTTNFHQKYHCSKGCHVTLRLHRFQTSRQSKRVYRGVPSLL